MKVATSYLLQNDEVSILENETKKLLGPSEVLGQKSRAEDANQTQSATDNGILREKITPVNNHETGVRRSKRTKIVVSSIYS